MSTDVFVVFFEFFVSSYISLILGVLSFCNMHFNISFTNILTSSYSFTHTFNSSTVIAQLENSCFSIARWPIQIPVTFISKLSIFVNISKQHPLLLLIHGDEIRTRKSSQKVWVNMAAKVCLEKTHAQQ